MTLNVEGLKKVAKPVALAAVGVGTAVFGAGVVVGRKLAKKEAKQEEVGETELEIVQTAN